MSKRTKANHQEDTTGIYIVPKCPLHGFTGPNSILPQAQGCKSCVEVLALYACASSDPEQSFLKTNMLHELIHHWAEDIESGKFTTVDDLVRYPKFHVGDGGYYDNFGVVSAVQFLKQMLPYYKERYSGKSVLFIEIQASPRAGELSPENKWGYAEQAVGPISTLLNVRTNAQLFRNEVELELLKKQWESSGGIWKDVVFAFKNANPPLSWHMTPQEKIDINKNWTEYQGATAEDVGKVLHCAEP